MIPDAGDLAAFRDLAGRLAREAGGLLLSRRDMEMGTGTKSSPTDLVTRADRAAERLVLDGIHAARPQDSVLGEEGGSRAGSSDVRWIVDPLDGTVNYVYGVPAFGVSIATEVAGRVVAGAVYDPSHDLLYDAVLGAGARCSGVPLRCSGAASLGLSLIGTGFAYVADRRARQGRVLAGLLPAVRDIRRFGAAALDLCWVGAGRLDGFYEVGLEPWDVAAGLLIAAEAGAPTAQLETPGGVMTVAAAPAVFAELRDLLVVLHAGTGRDRV